MSVDSNTTDKIETILHHAGCPKSGEIADDIYQQFVGDLENQVRDLEIENRRLYDALESTTSMYGDH